MSSIAPDPAKLEPYRLEPGLCAALGRAQAGLARLDLLARLWPPFSKFVLGPLTARAALAQCGLEGHRLDPVVLLALGPQPEPNRPAKALRRAVGLTRACRRLESDPTAPLTPSLVGDLLLSLDAPELARGHTSSNAAPWGNHPAPGSAAWSLAPRLVTAGLPPLMALGLTCAAWLRDGPDHPHREPLAWVLNYGLALRLGLPAAGFLGLGPAVGEAAEAEGGLKRIYKEMRASGSWRAWLGVWARAVEANAGQVLETCLAARRVAEDHAEVINTWVRAPRLPLRLLELFLVRPVLDLPGIAAELEITQRSAGLLCAKLKEQGLINEVTGQRRGKRYAYQAVVELVGPSGAEQSD